MTRRAPSRIHEAATPGTAAELTTDIANLKLRLARLQDEKKQLEARAAVLRARFLRNEASTRRRRA